MITEYYLFRLAKLENLSLLKAGLPNLRTAEIGQLTNVKNLPNLSESHIENLCFEKHGEGF